MHVLNFGHVLKSSFNISNFTTWYFWLHSYQNQFNKAQLNWTQPDLIKLNRTQPDSTGLTGLNQTQPDQTQPESTWLNQITLSIWLKSNWLNLLELPTSLHRFTWTELKLSNWPENCQNTTVFPYVITCLDQVEKNGIEFWKGFKSFIIFWSLSKTDNWWLSSHSSLARFSIMGSTLLPARSLASFYQLCWMSGMEKKCQDKVGA